MEGVDLTNTRIGLWSLRCEFPDDVWAVVDRSVAPGELAGRRLQEIVGARGAGPKRDDRDDPDEREPERQGGPLCGGSGGHGAHSSALIPSWTSWAVSTRRVRVTPGCRADIPDHSVVARPKS